MKKMIALLLTFCMLSALLCACGGDVTLAGSGTEADPYRIDSPEALRTMAKLIEEDESWQTYVVAHYVLTADIDLGGKEWTPISYFKGVLDGNGHTISGLKISYSAPLVGEKQQCFGLFAEMRDAAVKNLTISNSTITVKGDAGYAGAIAGRGGKVTVENCHVTESVTVTAPQMAGGLFGNVGSESPIAGCTNAAAITCTSTVGYAGGIAARCDAVLQNCSNSGNIVSEGDAGGLVCTANNSILDCSNSGSVTANDGDCGGICNSFGDGALNKESSDATVTVARCVNTGDVTSATETAGGIAASAQTGSIVDCSNSGNVLSRQAEAGGIVGFFLPSAFGVEAKVFTVSGCSNSGSITSEVEGANEAVGGIIGMIYPCSVEVTVSDCANTGSVLSVMTPGIVDSIGEAGGIVGSSRAHRLILRSCSNTADITGTTIAGGIVGRAVPNEAEAPDSLFLAENCTNSGTVTASDPGGLVKECYTAGIVAHAGIVQESQGVFASTTVTGCTNTGKLVCDAPHYCAHDFCASDLSTVYDE